MSETQEPEHRPWHGAESPFEALYQWAQSEFRKIRGEPDLAQDPEPEEVVVPEQPEAQS